MTKRKKRSPEARKKRSRLIFAICMVLYAAVFLSGIAYGLDWFWDFIAAYEASRPANTIDAYMEQLTDEHLCDSAADMIAQVDHNIQSEEQCRQMIKDSVAGGISYARKSSASTENQTVYVLRSGSRVIGSVTMSAVEIDEYGFTLWEISEESFDFSFLWGESYCVTVPSDYPVYVNGVRLDSSYITESDIPYDALEAFYDDYDLPTMVTYETGTFLGAPGMEVTDPEGKTVVISEDTDYNAFLSNCSNVEVSELTDFMDIFLERYVAFTGSANKTSAASYTKLMNYVVSGSDLAVRMQKALDGLAYAQSRGDTIVSITNNQFIQIADDRYICDVTYVVDTTGREGVVQTTLNAKVVVVRTASGLKVETLVSY